MSNPSPTVGFFTTCLVDLMRPVVGLAAVRLLEMAGCRVSVPPSQTCCGQPAYNSGDLADTKDIARQVIDAFAGFDYVVVPSGSCAGMIREHYPELFRDDGDMAVRARDLAARTFELTSFLHDVLHVADFQAAFGGEITYSDSCSGLRELGIKDQPRALLAKVAGLSLTEMEGSDICCGFGGSFSVKYPSISGHMVGAKVDAVRATGAPTLLGGDLGCLLNMAGRLKREGSSVQVRHIAEVLAGMTETTPPIGDEPDTTPVRSG
jgi:L-lactate dehydrogenase complex protein LldE